jgi:glucan-binding YG repeat protein
MRKQTKLAVAISAASLLAVGASMTALAAAGWVNEGGNWYYLNSSGDVVTDAWKSYNGQYFYLGDDGAMLTNELIEDGDNHYYVDANGAMVKNTWVAIPADDAEENDVEYRWYYFGATGKAYKSSYGKTINGKKYGFDDDGKMLFGYVDESSYSILNDDDDPILGATYYYGTNEDGARHSGWLQYTDALTDKDWDYYWFYFKPSNGKKVNGKTQNINGKKYAFDADGIMQKEWSSATVAGSDTMTWWGALSDGSLAKNSWIRNKPYEGCTLKKNQDDREDETQRWFRADASGKLIKGQSKKVNGKWYTFDADGVMVWGLVVLDQPQVSGSHTVGKTAITDERGKIDTDVIGEDELHSYGPGRTLHFFSNDEERDGSMKTGTYKIELADDEKTFSFTKTTGASKHGISDKKIYWDGILQKAGDNKYKVVTDPDSGTKYIVGSTGNIVKSVNKYKNADDMYYIYLGVGQIYKTYDEDAAKAAVKAKASSGTYADGSSWSVDPA